MPHVEIEGTDHLAAFHVRFRPRTVRDGGAILKAVSSYMARDGTNLLVECLVVEGHLRQAFFVLMTGRAGRSVVRIHPRTVPEKTRAVKRCVAWIALWFLETGEGAGRIGSTNLGTLLEAPFEATGRAVR